MSQEQSNKCTNSGESDIKEIFSKCDKDKDGYLIKTEFDEFITIMTEKAPFEQMYQGFCYMFKKDPKQGFDYQSAYSLWAKMQPPKKPDISSIKQKVQQGLLQKKQQQKEYNNNNNKEYSNKYPIINVLFQWHRTATFEFIFDGGNVLKYEVNIYDGHLNDEDEIKNINATQKYSIQFSNDDDNNNNKMYDEKIVFYDIRINGKLATDRWSHIKYAIRTRAILNNGTKTEYSKWINIKTTPKLPDHSRWLRHYAVYDKFWEEHMDINGNNTINMEQWIVLCQDILKIDLSEFALKRIYFYIKNSKIGEAEQAVARSCNAMGITEIRDEKPKKKIITKNKNAFDFHKNDLRAFAGDGIKSRYDKFVCNEWTEFRSKIYERIHGKTKQEAEEEKDDNIIPIINVLFRTNPTQFEFLLNTKNVNIEYKNKNKILLLVYGYIREIIVIFENDIIVPNDLKHIIFNYSQIFVERYELNVYKGKLEENEMNNLNETQYAIKYIEDINDDNIAICDVKLSDLFDKNDGNNNAFRHFRSSWCVRSRAILIGGSTTNYSKWMNLQTGPLMSTLIGYWSSGDPYGGFKSFWNKYMQNVNNVKQWIFVWTEIVNIDINQYDLKRIYFYLCRNSKEKTLDKQEMQKFVGKNYNPNRIYFHCKEWVNFWSKIHKCIY